MTYRHTEPLREFHNQHLIRTHTIKHHFWKALHVRRPQKDTFNINPNKRKQHVLKERQIYHVSCGRPCDLASYVIHDSHIITNRQICHHMSINYSLHQVTGFQRDYAAAALLLPWSVTLCIISLPNLWCTFEIIFSGIVNAPRGVWTIFPQCAKWHDPANVHQRLARGDNYHVMIVIKIWATHFYKESFNDAGAESKRYCFTGL